MSTYGNLTWRKVNPVSVIPPDILHQFLRKDSDAIKEAKKWVDSYGLIILFTRGKAKGSERVWVTDGGEVFLNEEDHNPSLKELNARCRHANLLKEFEKNKEDKKEILKILQKNERPL